jgi:protein gp37
MRMMDFCKVQQKRGWPVLPNVWLGVSVEDQITADERIPLLLKTPAHVRWVSYEPALGPVDFSRWMDWSQGPALDWIVVGGESGPRARPFNPGWARQTIAQCQASLVPVFVKQLGSRVATDFVNGEAVVYGIKDRKGADPAEWPADLRVMEYPRP